MKRGMEPFLVLNRTISFKSVGPVRVTQSPERDMVKDKYIRREELSYYLTKALHDTAERQTHVFGHHDS